MVVRYIVHCRLRSFRRLLPYAQCNIRPVSSRYAVARSRSSCLHDGGGSARLVCHGLMKRAAFARKQVVPRETGAYAPA